MAKTSTMPSYRPLLRTICSTGRRDRRYHAEALIAIWKRLLVPAPLHSPINKKARWKATPELAANIAKAVKEASKVFETKLSKNPQLRGKPVIVAWKGNRSVVCAASYEARAFGVHSAMPTVRAVCFYSAAIFIAPDFTRYRVVSRSVREIFKPHTDMIEPLSLDEAYLDVTENKTGLPRQESSGQGPPCLFRVSFDSLARPHRVTHP